MRETRETMQEQTATDLVMDQEGSKASTTDDGLPDVFSDASLLNWLEAAAGGHPLGLPGYKIARLSFNAKLGLRDAIQGEMYREAAHHAQRLGWEYEPEDGTWRENGVLQCVEESLVAYLATITKVTP